MNKVDFRGVVVRECDGLGLIALIPDEKMNSDFKKIDIDVRFAITGKFEGDDYTLSLTAGDINMTTLLNSDHILIMKQILKEMGEI